MNYEAHPTNIPGLVDVTVTDDQGRLIQTYTDLTPAQASALPSNPAVQGDLQLRQIAANLVR